MEDSRFFLQNSLLPVVVVCDDNDGVPPRTVLVSSSRLGYFEDAARRPLQCHVFNQRQRVPSSETTNETVALSYRINFLNPSREKKHGERKTLSRTLIITRWTIQATTLSNNGTTDRASKRPTKPTDRRYSRRGTGILGRTYRTTTLTKSTRVSGTPP